MRVRRSASLCTVSVVAPLVVTMVPAVGHAAADKPSAMTSSGVRCTIVGTRGPDVLKGTPGRDVICSLGGNDRIDGRGGNDIVDGGPGNDRVTGGPGSDRLYGGSGSDYVNGQGGTDLIDGGPAHDRLLGDAGNDRIDGAGGNDDVSGGTGDDDVVGGGGSDDLAGGAGADTVDGGSGDDVETGGSGDDVLTGEGGDDELSGGPGGDDVDGGAGFNICDAPSEVADSQVRCVVDQSRPVVGDLTSDPTTVDVSDADQLVRVRAHVTDDTGVSSVQIYNQARLVSGTTRDGVWESTIRVPRFITEGWRDVNIDVKDRVGRWTSDSRANVYNVVNSVVDQEMPFLESLILDKDTVDVRSASKSITGTVRITDDLAGPWDVVLCPAHAFATGTPSFRQAGACVGMERVSGTRKDSTWTATYDVAKRAPSGTWNFEVWMQDASGNFGTDYWLGPDGLAAVDPADRSWYHAIPDGAGVFIVQGSPQDLNAPALTSVSLSPSGVDTSTGGVKVTAEVSATDLEGIKGAELYIGGYAGYPNNENWVDHLQIVWAQDFKLVSGTRKDGTWRTTFVVPGGTPDGTYFMSVALEDAGQWEAWVSPDSGWETDNQILTPGLAPTGNYFVVANQ